MATKTQRRAICPACFAEQAITKSGAMVAHGYKRPQHWHQNVGNCAGVGRKHFGTAAGRDYTAWIATDLRTSADSSDITAQQVIDGTKPAMMRKMVGNGVYMMVINDKATDYDRTRYAESLRAAAKQLRGQAAEFDKMVAAWTPAEPKTVAVESREPLLHWRADRGWLKGLRACAGMMMTAHTGNMTTDIAQVTCEKCRLRHEHLMAKK